ncbi:MAG: DUF4340 domain-containing protein, partial [Treponema sp.]|nr:DUF4340 domain-containing protein [Treponema sp.]
IILKPAPEDSAAAEAPAQEYILRLEEIKSVAVKNPEDEFVVVSSAVSEPVEDSADPRAADPFIEGFEGYAMSVWDLNRMLQIPAELVSRGLVDENPGDLSLFGLDPPRAEVRVETAGGTAALYIGNDAPDGSNIYVGKEGFPGVYLADSWNLGNYLKRALDFADTAVSPAGTDDGRGSFVFDSIRLGGSVRSGAEITVVKEDQNPSGDEASDIMSSPYRITAPIEARFSMDKGLPVLQGIFGIRASRAVSKSGGDLDRWGLARPWSTARVNGTMEKGLGGFSVRASAPDSQGNVYLMKEGSDLVFQAAAADLPWLSVTWFDLMEKLIVLPFIDTVASVEVRTPERTVEFTLSGEGDDLKVRAGGVELDPPVFRSYYQTLLTASYDEKTDTSPASLPEAFLEIVYRYRSGKSPEHIRFYSTGSRRVLVNYNGGRVYVTLAAYTDKVIADLDQVLAGQKVLPYL